MRKVLLITDGQNWFVDRACREFIKYMKYDFTLKQRSDFTVQSLIDESVNYDLIHYANWGVAKIKDAIPHIKTPQILTVRSHRFPDWLKETAKHVDIVQTSNSKLEAMFENGYYVPDGIFFDESNAKPFKVGMAFQDIDENREYKGYYLVKKACDNLGLQLDVVSDLEPEKMPEWLKSLSLYICASEAEGFNTMVMECMALNVPVITTDVGVPQFLNIHKIDRTVYSIQSTIQKFYTQKQIYPFYTWVNVCKQLSSLYDKLLV